MEKRETAVRVAAAGTPAPRSCHAGPSRSEIAPIAARAGEAASRLLGQTAYHGSEAVADVSMDDAVQKSPFVDQVAALIDETVADDDAPPVVGAAMEAVVFVMITVVIMI